MMSEVVAVVAVVIYGIEYDDVVGNEAFLRFQISML